MRLLMVLLIIAFTSMDADAQRRSRSVMITPELARLIIDSANAEGLDPLLVTALMHNESGFNPFAVSPVGAKGLMQFMPATARRFGITNRYDPYQSIPAGCKYLAYLIKLFDGRIELALAGYNAGENAVIKHGYRVPPYRETRNYVRSIIASYKRALAIADGRGVTIPQQMQIQTRPLTNRDIANRLARLDELMMGK